MAMRSVLDKLAFSPPKKEQFSSVGPYKYREQLLPGSEQTANIVKLPIKKSPTEMIEQDPIDKMLKTILMMHMTGGHQAPGMQNMAPLLALQGMGSGKTAADQDTLQKLTGGSMNRYAQNIIKELQPEHYEQAGGAGSKDTIQNLIENIIPQQILRTHASRVGHGNPEMGQKLIEDFLGPSYHDTGEALPNALKRLLTTHLQDVGEAQKHHALMGVNLEPQRRPRAGVQDWLKTINEHAPKPEQDPYRFHQEAKYASIGSIPYTREVLLKVGAAYGLGALRSAAKAAPEVLKGIPDTLKETWQGVKALPGQAAGAMLNNPKATAIGAGALSGTAAGGAALHHLLSGGGGEAAVPTIPAAQVAQSMMDVAGPAASGALGGAGSALGDAAAASGGIGETLLHIAPWLAGGAALGGGGAALYKWLKNRKAKKKELNKETDDEHTPGVDKFSAENPRGGVLSRVAKSPLTWAAGGAAAPFAAPVVAPALMSAFLAMPWAPLLVGGAGALGGLAARGLARKGPDISNRAVSPFYTPDEGGRARALSITPELLQSVVAQSPQVGALGRSVSDDVLNLLPKALGAGKIRGSLRKLMHGGNWDAAKKVLESMTYATHGDPTSPATHIESITGQSGRRAGEALADVLRSARRAGQPSGALGAMTDRTGMGGMQVKDDFQDQVQQALIHRLMAGSPMATARA